LEEARRRTLQLVATLTDDELNRVYSPILSPLAWDLGHIANFEELWLVQTIGRREPLHGELGRLYDAIENPRYSRGELPILRGAELRSYLEDVRTRALDVLAEVDLDSDEDPLLAGAFVYELLIAHEHQHTETMLQLIQMIDGYEPVESTRPPEPDPADAAGPEMVLVEGGEVQIGAGAEGFAYDNERPRHTVRLDPFWIDRTPVTNAAYADFMRETDVEPPMYWEPDGDGWWARTAMGRGERVDPAQPVVHVSWHEAEAFARWAGKRLPTEAEWETAARGADRRRANLDQLAFACAPVGAFADAPSDCGAIHMLGDVWEWTSSDFLAYPGFRAFPYKEY
jgi:iron(II)-dependent oxidoreductase